MKTQLVKKTVLGIDITNSTEKEILEYVSDQVENTKKKLFIVTPNPEMVVAAQTQPYFKELINKADIALCDGVGLFSAAKILGTPLSERITGTDFMKTLCEKASKEAYSIGFLGGRGGVAEKAAECLKRICPGLRVHFTGEEWDVQRFPKQGVDILFVAYGFPKQEEWIEKNLPLLPIRVAMGVGGAFDYYSGTVLRAPLVIRSIGLEWLFRLVRQPWRIKRQARLLSFIRLVVQTRIQERT